MTRSDYTRASANFANSEGGYYPRDSFRPAEYGVTEIILSQSPLIIRSGSTSSGRGVRSGVLIGNSEFAIQNGDTEAESARRANEENLFLPKSQ